jgi:phosphoribosylglycinamide formyltransferase-1
MKSIAILISGRGSNMQALLDADPGCKIGVVISNKSDAGGLDFARKRGIPTAVVSHKDHPDRESFDAALSCEIEKFGPDFIVLAGFMRILTEGFVKKYQGRMVNIHPSLLPAYPGMHTHARALMDGVKIHGCTVHFVTPDLDHGPIIIQAAVPVLEGDTEQSLSARVLKEEHRIYPQAVGWLCSGKVMLNAQGKVVHKGSLPCSGSLVFPPLETV